MSTIGWVILLVLAIPIVGLLGWLWITTSLVRIPSGKIGLLLIKGKATDTVLPPGPHFVPALRRRMVEEYPSVELAYRAGGTDDASDDDLERAGPALKVALGDRTSAIVPYTVRFRLMMEHLRQLHERFGPSGIFGIVRDESSRAVSTVLGDPAVTVEDMFGKAQQACQEKLTEAVRDALSADGIEVTAFLLDTVDLGRTGEVIQATIRSRYELEQEQAEAGTRLARAVNVADLEQRFSSSSEAALRYRETDLLRDLVQRSEALHVALRAARGGALGIGTAGTEPEEFLP